MKPKPAPTPEPKQAPVIVAIPNTVDRKMQAILATAEAVRELAKALNSVNVSVHIEDCEFHNMHTGVEVK